MVAMPRARTPVLEPGRYYDIAAVADFLGVRVDTVRVYRTRSAANRRAGTPQPGDLPEEDDRFGRSPVWLGSTLLGWERPGSGAGGGRPKTT